MRPFSKYTQEIVEVEGHITDHSWFDGIKYPIVWLREGITIDNLQVLAIPNNKRYHLFCTTGERSPERRNEYRVTDNILFVVMCEYA
ncbi:hypothetical protein JTB14_029475 [Gonioctena quinquepunctata]|nr:hypothetical protein JTB14_029475 [Gonioctena quinquepunctata]